MVSNGFKMQKIIIDDKNFTKVLEYILKSIGVYIEKYWSIY